MVAGGCLEILELSVGAGSDEGHIDSSVRDQLGHPGHAVGDRGAGKYRECIRAPGGDARGSERYFVTLDMVAPLLCYR